MEEVIVKREMQDNEEILLFYVDENGGNEEGILTTVENIKHQAVELQQDSAYVIENIHEYPGEVTLAQGTYLNDQWTDDDVQKLLIFYSDNRQTFLTGATKKEHLWTVACKTMLIGKTPNACETKLQELRSRWLAEICDTVNPHINDGWPYFRLCHQAFAEEEPAFCLPPEDEDQIQTPVGVTKNTKSNVDSDIMTMLELYLKYKRNFQNEFSRRSLWETIAMEIGKEDGEYWQKRFLNYKHHYIRLLDKIKTSGPNSITWPYMDYFDKIFEGDIDFQSKFVEVPKNRAEDKAPTVIEWDMTEKTVLVKYCYDCYEEFNDPTIPNTFLWNEIGRLLDRSPESCKEKYKELRKAHLEHYLQGMYGLRVRVPIQILFDSVITKDIEYKFVKSRSKPEELEIWKTEELDELVQFFYDNIELYKDLNSHFVCWAAIAEKLNRNVESCRSQWEDLVTLYKTILNDKKENPDMQIDWRYIELFDRIFDYGMDDNLLKGYEQYIAPVREDTGKIAAKKVTINLEVESKPVFSEDEEFDERGFTKRTKRQAGNTKAWKILEYYHKNKEKFATTNKNQQYLWEILGNKIGITGTQCAHKLRNLKQMYTGYVQRELTKPEMPIVWQYYALCKKVFGYRAVKNKLKNGLADEREDWTAREIRMLISYFAKHFDEFGDELDDVSKWAGVAGTLGKSETSCKEKFMELRKSYRKLRTMKTRNLDVKISWKYFDTMEKIYTRQDIDMEVDGTEDEERVAEDTMEHDDDDYECIIVMPEGQDISQIDSSNVIVRQKLENGSVSDNPKPVNKWTKRLKKRLIGLYINYVRLHKNQEINSKDMWMDIASKLSEKTPVVCKRLFIKLKTNYKKMGETERQNSPYHNLFQKVLRLKPKFVKSEQNTELKSKVYKDVNLPDEKVEKALKYYLQHIEDFVSPRYEKKYLWTELANFISEPVTKVFNKLNYLKQVANEDTVELANSPFRDLLKEIWAKEIAIKLVIDNEPKPSIEESNVEETWTDDEVEQLLQWYLSNLEKFKNPKFVRSYLWMEVSKGLDKTALNCSKKMSEIRTRYRNMVRETPEFLSNWRFHDLCQKIYGTGKKEISSVS